MPGVRAREGERIETLIRRWKKQLEKNGVMYDIRRKEYYEKPSIVKNRERRKARRRNNF